MLTSFLLQHYCGVGVYVMIAEGNNQLPYILQHVLASNTVYGVRAALTADSTSNNVPSGSHHPEPAPARLQQNVHAARSDTSTEPDFSLMSLPAPSPVEASTSVEMLTAPKYCTLSQTILPAAPVTPEPGSVWVSRF